MMFYWLRIIQTFVPAWAIAEQRIFRPCRKVPSLWRFPPHP